MNWVGEQESKEDEQDFEGSLDRLSLSIGMSSRSQSSLNSIPVSILYKFPMLEVAISSSHFLIFLPFNYSRCLHQAIDFLSNDEEAFIN